MTNCFSQALLFFESISDGSLSGRHLYVSETSHRNNLSHIKERHEDTGYALVYFNLS